jgi:hypothetical protein
MGTTRMGLSSAGFKSWTNIKKCYVSYSRKENSACYFRQKRSIRNMPEGLLICWECRSGIPDEPIFLHYFDQNKLIDINHHGRQLPRYQAIVVSYPNHVLLLAYFILSELGCRTVANMLKGRTDEEIRTLFNIRNSETG